MILRIYDYLYSRKKKERFITLLESKDITFLENVSLCLKRNTHANQTRRAWTFGQ